MPTRNLPLDTWMVIKHSSARDVTLISRHRTQRAAEAERDRRNRSSSDRTYQACIVLEPIAQRMGGQLAPTSTPRRSRALQRTR
jgi:hypothetical protein